MSYSLTPRNTRELTSNACVAATAATQSANVQAAWGSSASVAELSERDPTGSLCQQSAGLRKQPYHLWRTPLPRMVNGQCSRNLLASQGNVREIARREVRYGQPCDL